MEPAPQLAGTERVQQLSHMAAFRRDFGKVVGLKGGLSEKIDISFSNSRFNRTCGIWLRDSREQEYGDDEKRFFR